LQHASLEVPELGTGLDPELVDKRPAGVPEGPKSIGLTAGPIQGKHQLRVEPLTQWHSFDQIRQLTDRVSVAAQPELQLHPTFGRRPPQLVEARDLATGEVHAGDIFERITPPKTKGARNLIKRVEKLCLGAEAVQMRKGPHRCLEPMGIDVLRLGHQRIATGPGLQQGRLAIPSRTQGLAQV
jgi:hypothetical protein